MKSVSLTTRLLALPFFLLGPLMALMPRQLMIWLILVTLILLRELGTHWQTIKKNIDKQALLLLVLTIGYSAISAAWSPSPKAFLMAIDITYLTFCCWVIFVSLPFLKSEETKRILMPLFTAGFIVGIGFLLFESFNDHPLHRWFEHLNASEKVDENVPKRMAAIFALGIWPCALWLKTKGKKILSVAAVILYLAISVFLTNRSALLGMIVGTAVMFFAFYQAALARWGLMMLLSLGLFFVVPISILLPLAPPDVTGQLFDSAQQRISIWTKTAQHVLEAPLQGHGLDSSKGLETVMENDQKFYQPGAQVISQHPHNIFLQIWLDFGFAGALMWGALLYILADRIRFLNETAQPYVLGAAYCSLMMLNTTFSIMQAWWLSGHAATLILFMIMGYSLSRSAETSGTSAGGISNS